MAVEARVTVDLLPALRIVDGVVVVHSISRGTGEALVHACNLANVQLPVHE